MSCTDHRTAVTGMCHCVSATCNILILEYKILDLVKLKVTLRLDMPRWFCVFGRWGWGVVGVYSCTLVTVDTEQGEC